MCGLNGHPWPLTLIPAFFLLCVSKSLAFFLAPATQQVTWEQQWSLSTMVDVVQRGRQVIVMNGLKQFSLLREMTQLR